MSVANTILLQGEESENHEERNATGGTILPGHLLLLQSDNTVIPHNAAGAKAMPWVAKEDYLQGRPITRLYDDGDVVMIHSCQKGDKLNMVLAASQTISVGDKLTSNGDGKLKEANGTTDAELFTAAEAVTTGVGETKRIAVYHN